MTADDMILRAAKVIYSAMHRDTDPYSVPLERAAEKAVRALAESGLIAPAPLREEWSTTDEWGDQDYCCGFDARETVEGDGRPIVRRFVSDWLPVDPAEGDGSADR